LNDYPDRTIFIIIEDGNDNIGESTQQGSSQSSQYNSTPSRRPLAVVKVVRADLGRNGKPSNFHTHNLTAHVNIYTLGQACVPFVCSKVCEEMGNKTLKLVGTNGLALYNQDGTRGMCFTIH